MWRNTNWLLKEVGEQVTSFDLLCSASLYLISFASIDWIECFAAGM